VLASVLTVPALALSLCARADTPEMDYDKPVVCISQPDGKFIRLQCTEEPGSCRCLRSGSNIIGADGKPTDKFMERTNSCSEYKDPAFLDTLAQAGCRVEDAIADAPPGYARDENGRLFQIAFDMGNRFYIGGRWNPVFDQDGKVLGRGGVDFGLRISDDELWDGKRHRHRVLEGQVSFAPVDFDILLWRYDLGARRDEPGVWVTTFIGGPRRFDFDLDVGWGMRMLRANYHPLRSENYTDLENLWIYPSVEVYHNKNLANYLRIAVGPACGELLSGDADDDARFSIYPQAAVDAEFGLDDAGLFGLGFSAAGSARAYVDDYDTWYRVAEASAWTEWILLALNDQPIALFLQGTAGYREDIPDAPADLELRAMAGLRFSFWAPVPEDMN
jgi:hypothetical protein